MPTFVAFHNNSSDWFILFQECFVKLFGSKDLAHLTYLIGFSSNCLSVWPRGALDLSGLSLVLWTVSTITLVWLTSYILLLGWTNKECFANCKALSKLKVVICKFSRHSLRTLWHNDRAINCWCVVSSYINQMWGALLMFTPQAVLDLPELFLNSSILAKYLTELLSFHSEYVFYIKFSLRTLLD